MKGLYDDCWAVINSGGNLKLCHGRRIVYRTRLQAELEAEIFSGDRVMQYGEWRRQSALDKAVRLFLKENSYNPHFFLSTFGIPYWAVNGIRANFARIIETIA